MSKATYCIFYYIYLLYQYIDVQAYEKDTFSFYRSLPKFKHYGSKVYRQFYWKMEN